jgi:hypothetical protein
MNLSQNVMARAQPRVEIEMQPGVKSAKFIC